MYSGSVAMRYYISAFYKRRVLAGFLQPLQLMLR